MGILDDIKLRDVKKGFFGTFETAMKPFDYESRFIGRPMTKAAINAMAAIMYPAEQLPGIGDDIRRGRKKATPLLQMLGENVLVPSSFIGPTQFLKASKIAKAGYKGYKGIDTARDATKPADIARSIITSTAKGPVRPGQARKIPRFAVRKPSTTLENEIEPKPHRFYETIGNVHWRDEAYASGVYTDTGPNPWRFQTNEWHTPGTVASSKRNRIFYKVDPDIKVLDLSTKKGKDILDRAKTIVSKQGDHKWLDDERKYSNILNSHDAQTEKLRKLLIEDGWDAVLHGGVGGPQGDKLAGELLALRPEILKPFAAGRRVPDEIAKEFLRTGNLPKQYELMADYLKPVGTKKLPSNDSGGFKEAVRSMMREAFGGNAKQIISPEDEEKFAREFFKKGGEDNLSYPTGRLNDAPMGEIESESDIELMLGRGKAPLPGRGTTPEEYANAVKNKDIPLEKLSDEDLAKIRDSVWTQRRSILHENLTDYKSHPAFEFVNKRFEEIEDEMKKRGLMEQQFKKADEAYSSFKEGTPAKDLLSEVTIEINKASGTSQDKLIELGKKAVIYEGNRKISKKQLDYLLKLLKHGEDYLGQMEKGGIVI